MAQFYAKTYIGRGLMFFAPAVMVGSAAYLAYTIGNDIVSDIKRKNAAKPQTAQTVEPEAPTVKTTSLRQ
ncbi:MAG TPA: hypothetical protein VGV92_02485 [Gammaproteobacteria bacterium]|nr:hypothetical protein [Gammaproteobacteria bacterium]